MVASILDGKAVASHFLQELKLSALTRKQHGLRTPGLAVILLGNDPASHIYVNNKRKACLNIGFHSFNYDLPLQTKETELLKLIDQLNESNTIDGILVQLPLPKHISTATVIERINPKKDVDGFHPYNLGRLAQGNPLLRPCTPYGIIRMLAQYKIELTGLNAVVVGASNIVGRPMALELLAAKATVTICHRATQNIHEHLQKANLVVIATGIPDALNNDWMHKDQIIIDVGIHRDANGHIRGDVDFNKAREKVAWITPVRGDAGPMTISTLLNNTLFAATLADD